MTAAIAMTFQALSPPTRDLSGLIKLMRLIANGFQNLIGPINPIQYIFVHGFGKDFAEFDFS